MIDYPESERVISLMLTWQCNLNCKYCFEEYKTTGKKMPINLAKEIIKKEFSDFKAKGNKGKLKIEFFGGEPLLRFDLIQEVTEWIEKSEFETCYELSLTSNGTLLDENKKAWFKKHKEHIRIVLSVDGSNEMQKANRGNAAGNIPIQFVRETWPDIHFKSTISRANLPQMSKGLISLLEEGHNIAPSLAVGEDWKEGDEAIYKQELEKLADWYLEHLEKEPMKLLLQPFYSLLEPHISNTPKKNCGTGTSMGTYDVDGTCYPCHLFVPITHGNNNVLKDIESINFNDDELFIDEECKNCKVLRICKTCYGFNYKDRRSLKKRDKRACKMQLAEAQAISDFQINYYVKMKELRKLTSAELFALQGAIKCYELYNDVTI